MEGAHKFLLLISLSFMPNLLVAQFQLVNPIEGVDKFWGGILTIVDKTHKLDDDHNACGLLAVCRGMSLGPTLRRSDGSLEVQKGFLRGIVDGIGEAMFKAIRPVLPLIGMSRVARQEITFATFIIDLLDSAIIGLGRIIGGRRLVRQFEAVSPVLSFIGPAIQFVGAIPKPYIASIADFTMDAFGVANTRSGVYKVMRAGAMGYAYGDNPDTDVCTQLDADSPDERCVGDGSGFDLLGLLNPINDHHLGESLRVNPKANPLYTRTRNPQAAEYNKFEMSDLINPLSAMCKLDNMLNAVNGHIDVVDNGEGTLPPYLQLDDIDLTTINPFTTTTTSTTAIIQVKSDDKSDEDVQQTRLQLTRDSELVVRIMKRLEEEQNKPDPYVKPIERGATPQDKFTNHCQEQNAVAKRKYYQERLAFLNNTITSAENDNDEEDLEDIEEEEDVVEAKQRMIIEEEKTDEERVSEIELFTELGERSLLFEKMEIVDEDNLRKEVEDLIETFDVSVDGEVERAVEVRSRKGSSTVLVEFDSSYYRDSVLRQSRTSRNLSTVRLRKLKMRDLKLVGDLLSLLE